MEATCMDCNKLCFINDEMDLLSHVPGLQGTTAPLAVLVAGHGIKHVNEPSGLGKKHFWFQKNIFKNARLLSKFLKIKPFKNFPLYSSYIINEWQALCTSTVYVYTYTL